MADIMVDASVAAAFAKAAELLARPLSPTVAEREAPHASQDGNYVVAPANVSPVVATRNVGSTRSAPQRTADPGLATSAAAAQNAAEIDAMPRAGQSAPVDEPAPAEVVSGLGSILSAVAELSILQKGLKEKINSPSNRKSGPPKMRRAAPKVMTESERQHKMGEIAALEEQLRKAQGKATASAAPSAVAARPPQTSACDLVGDDGADSVAGSADQDDGGVASSPSRRPGRHGSNSSGDADALSSQRQAEERVRARRRQELKERREKERREAEEKRARHAEAEAKAQELERLARDRVQERLREERAKEQQERERQEREQSERQQRAEAAAAELRLQAARRIQEREMTERQRKAEEERLRLHAQQAQAEENAARAAELQEKTRQRMLQHAREQREQQLAKEEEERRRREEEAHAALQKQQQALMSQQQARARAAEFRRRKQEEEAEHSRMEQERLLRERELAEAALEVRHRKRQMRVGAAPVSADNLPPASPASSSSGGPGAVERKLRPSRESPAPEATTAQRVCAAAPVLVAAAAAAPAASPATEAPRHSREAAPAGRLAPIPPRLPGRGAERRAGREPSPATKRGGDGGPGRRPSSREPAGRGDLRLSDEVDHISFDSKGLSCAVAPLAVEDGSVKCTVGFFGLGGPLDDGDRDCAPHDECAGDEFENEDARDDAETSKVVAAPPRIPMRQGPTALAVNAAIARVLPQRSYSQPPPARSQQPASRASTPGPRELCEPPNPGSPGAASNRSDPAQCTQVGPKPTPWRQKPIQVNSADYYLDALRQARGVGSKAECGKKGSGYASQVRQRASEVKDAQRREAGEMEERGYAVLQRVQRRGLQATPTRSMSCDA
mmetsp:Transcript_127664/g.367392  ORF Transcript_127664/g.367392 Transcript_127664/m.367392 type:complete len:852 (-) Transcript_127664:110-2665(-)